MKERNAQITSTFLGREDHGILTIVLNLDYGGSCQGFGNWNLSGKSLATFVLGVLDTLEVLEWNRLPKTYCRARIEEGTIVAIGHITKDKWFSPREVLT